MPAETPAVLIAIVGRGAAEAHAQIDSNEETAFAQDAPRRAGVLLVAPLRTLRHHRRDVHRLPRIDTIVLLFSDRLWTFHSA